MKTIIFIFTTTLHDVLIIDYQVIDYQDETLTRDLQPYTPRSGVTEIVRAPSQQILIDPVNRMRCDSTMS